MKLLFTHQNFPGQYLHLARWAAGRAGFSPVAITDQANTRPDFIQTLRYKLPKPSTERLPGAVKRFNESVLRAEQTARAAMALRDRGFRPDIIFGHGAWGETLYLKEVFPDAKLIVYAEFYYRATGQNIGFDPEFDTIEPDVIRTIASQNATMSLALLGSDLGQVPTQFQANTFPPELRTKLAVAFDGIDTNVLKPDAQASYTLPNGKTVQAGDPMVTFINRNFEPYRGYHIFMRALPAILNRNPKAQIILVGGDGVSYGPAPSGPTSWRDTFLAEVADRLDLSRVHFVGQVPTGVLRQIYQVSAAHVYLTYPFVLSWSMLEAMSSGCAVIGADVAPVREIIRPNENGYLVDFFDVEALAEKVCAVLGGDEDVMAVRAAARATIVRDYDLYTQCLPAQLALLDRVLG